MEFYFESGGWETAAKNTYYINRFSDGGNECPEIGVIPNEVRKIGMNYR